MSLSDRLRADTRELHTAAERAGIMPALLRGTLERARYTALLRNLHAIYAALEPALVRHAAHAEVAPLVFPALFRQAALAADLAALHGPAWADELPLQPAALRGVARLHELDAQQPALLVAHAYVRSLGDLSGGQMLRTLVARSYGLAGDAGTRFYDFGDAAAVNRHQQLFRAGLAALEADAPRIDALVAEARWAFGLHAELFVELAGDQALPTKLRI
jgi:heme oxygenase (biliverdin-producing, ferredoxin)